MRTGIDGKHEHGIAHFVVAALALMAYPQQPEWFVAILLCGYAAILELGQCFAPGRSAALIDWVADMMAVILALVLVLALRFMGARF